ncbi:MAG: dTMP kinase [Anaerolineae bacterium]|nr:dTMP kinase [Gemmatimonadaceae bacterium]
MRTGRFIVIDGAEGVGKSTQAARLAQYLARDSPAPLVVREPGGTPAGETIRALLLDPRSALSARAEALLFMASRAELVDEVIAPALGRGQTVIADRFFLSTYAYQIGARNLPEEAVRAANHFATAGLAPDLTILLRLPAARGLARAAERGEHDRLEGAGNAFHEAVERAFMLFNEPYWQAAHPECGPVVAIDADGSADQVFARIVAAFKARWPESGEAGIRNQEPVTKS